MEVFVARQPIFDSEMNVFAYELLFRSSLKNFYDTRNDSNLSTLSVITSSLLVFGLDTLTSGKPAFINFTKKLLLRGTQASLPKELFAIEVIEGIEPDMLVLRACRELKDKGYLIVLDDFVLHDYKRTLLDIADIIKVDFRIPPRMNAHISCRHANTETSPCWPKRSKPPHTCRKHLTWATAISRAIILRGLRFCSRATLPAAGSTSCAL